MIARENCGCVRDLLVALFDKFLENLRPGAQPRVNLRVSMLAIRMPDDQIGCALQQSKERDEREEEPAPETMKPQG